MHIINAWVTATERAKFYTVTSDGEIHQLGPEPVAVDIKTDGSFAFYRYVSEATRAVRRVVETGKL